MKSRFCYFIHSGITGAKKIQRTKKNHFLYLFFSFVKIILITLSFYQILDMGIILCENTYVDKEINV